MGTNDELIVGGTQMGGSWHSCTAVPSLPAQEDASTPSIRGKSDLSWGNSWGSDGSLSVGQDFISFLDTRCLLE